MILLALGCDGPVAGPPPAPRGPPTLVARSTAEVEVAWPDLVFQPDGTLWVSWVEIAADEVADVFVARSDDGGASFGPKIRVDDVDTLFLGTVRQPVLAADAARVAIAVGGGTYLDSTIRLYVAAAGERPVFEGHVLDAARYLDATAGSSLTLVDQPELTFDADGLLRVNWKQGTRDEAFQLVEAREAEGFAVERLEDGVAGQPCECCPTDYLVWPDGEVLLAFRNNLRNLREVFVAAAAPGAPFDGSFQVSTTAFEIGGCPFDGPALAATPDGTLFATWADASLGDNYTWLAASADRGRSWTPSFLVDPDNTESQTWPTIAAAPDGTLWIATVEILHQTNLFSTTDGGATFARHPADAPGGPLFYSELAAGPDGLGLVGTTEQGELWFLDPEAP